MTTAQELKEPLVAQDLQLLPDFLPDVAIPWIETAKMRLERVNVIEKKVYFANTFNTPENVEKPSARRVTFAAEKQSLLPSLEHDLSIEHGAVFYNEDLTGIRDKGKENVAANPSRSSSRHSEGLSSFNYLFDEKLLWDNE